MSSYRLAPKDPEAALIRELNARELPEEHWCRGCCWATVQPPVFICPFIEGSCARLPDTLEHPDKEKLRGRIRAVRRIAAAQEEHKRRAEGRMTAAGEEMLRRKKANAVPLMECYGQHHTIVEWAKIAGMHESTLRKRMKKGMSLQEAIEMPVKAQFVTNGQTQEADDFIRRLRNAQR